MDDLMLPPLPEPGLHAMAEVDWNEFAPVHGYTADQMREYAKKAVEAAVWERHKRRGVLLFNPYSGKPRHPSDIDSDPHGILMLDPDEPIRAAR